jgi:excisionase family DNA binding protein
MKNGWLDADETASSLQITKATLYKLVNEGRIPARKIGGQWRFTRLDIEAMFAGTTASPRTGSPTIGSLTTGPERNHDA